ETLPEIVQLVGGAIHHLAEMLPNLHIDEKKMRENLAVTNGLIAAEVVAMQLAGDLGKMAAHELVEKATQKAVADGKHLREVLEQESEIKKHFDAKKLDEAFDPLKYLGMAEEAVTNTIKRHQNSGKEKA